MLQEFRQRIIIFQIIEQRSNWNPRPRKDRNAAQNLGIGYDEIVCHNCQSNGYVRILIPRRLFHNHSHPLGAAIQAHDALVYPRRTAPA